MAPCPPGQTMKKALDEAPKPGSKRRRVEEDAVIPCAVCGDKASGMHYRVHACEGCKVRENNRFLFLVLAVLNMPLLVVYYCNYMSYTYI